MESFEKTSAIAIKSTDSGGFRGYAAKFLNIDRQNDIIMPGAFNKAIHEFMADGGLVLADHSNRTSAVIGTLLNAQEDSSGLIVDVAFSATKSGQEIRQLVREKAVRKMSISFLAPKSVRYNEKQITDLWQKFGYTPSPDQKRIAKNGANIISEVAEVLEVSVVAIPANPEASIFAVKSCETQETPAVGASSQPDFGRLFERARAVDSLLLSRAAVSKSRKVQS